MIMAYIVMAVSAKDAIHRHLVMAYMSMAYIVMAVSAEEAFHRHFESQATALHNLVAVLHQSEHPAVVHGHGVVARWRFLFGFRPLSGVCWDGR